MNKTIIVALLALFVVPMAPNAAACNGVVVELIVEDGSPGGQGLYIDDRSTSITDPVHWIYLENNAVDGLQSGGPHAVYPQPDPTGLLIWSDSCMTYGAAGPDLLLY